MLNTLAVLCLLVYSLRKRRCCITLSILTFKKISAILLVACLTLYTLVLPFCGFLTCKYIKSVTCTFHAVVRP